MTAADHGHAVTEHVRDDGTIYRTIEVWSGETYLSLDYSEAVWLAIELVRGIKTEERNRKNEQFRTGTNEI